MRFVSRSQIDSTRWNRFVIEHPDFRHYYLTTYLDAATFQWEALINNDYSLIWPLPYKQFGVKRVYQPTFAQQLGPLMKRPDAELFKTAYDLVQRRYLAGRIKFHNDVPNDWVDSPIQNRNIELSFNQPLELIQKGFNRNVKSNLRKFNRAAGIIEREEGGGALTIELFRKHKGASIKGANRVFYAQLSNIYSAFHQLGQAEEWLAKTSDGELVGGVLLLTTNGRLLNLLSVASHTGRKMGAVHALFDEVVGQHHGRASSLDFEGSNDDNLAFFYRSFGGVERLYLQSEWCRLPWPLNQFL